MGTIGLRMIRKEALRYSIAEKSIHAFKPLEDSA
jgi:hypothetical protein